MRYYAFFGNFTVWPNVFFRFYDFRDSPEERILILQNQYIFYRNMQSSDDCRRGQWGISAHFNDFRPFIRQFYAHREPIVGCFVQFFPNKHYFADFSLRRRPEEHNIVDFVGVFDISVFIPVLIHYIYAFFVELRPNLFPAQGNVFIFVRVDFIQYPSDIFALFIGFCPAKQLFNTFSLFFIGF